MAIVTKFGAVTFTHSPNFTGEVEIERNGLAINVPFQALEKIVSDKVKLEMIGGIEKLKPHEILALAATKK